LHHQYGLRATGCYEHALSNPQDRHPGSAVSGELIFDDHAP
jgi:hypothetical protein